MTSENIDIYQAKFQQKYYMMDGWNLKMNIIV